MGRAFQLLVTLYPPHVRAIYGAEMLADIERRCDVARQRRFGALALLAREALTIVPDAICERIAAFSSHPSFHGRRPSNLGVVRPPDVGKRDWFFSEDGPQRQRTEIRGDDQREQR